jgi:long-chain acyl-CoA synthetase
VLSAYPDTVAHVSEHLDLRPGDRVALLQPGSAAYVDLVIGLLAEGVFPVPLDPRLTEAEREAILADVAPRLVVDTP